MTRIEIDLIALEHGDVALTQEALRVIKNRANTDPERFLEGPGTVAFAATIDEEPVGWAYGYVLDRPDGDRMMLLYEMEVSGSWRRKGIGRQLVGAFRQRAIEMGCSTMWLFTDDDNVDAQMLYQLEGAAPEGTRLQFAWRHLPLDEAHLDQTPVD